MLKTFQNRNFSLLWLAGLISLMGNWMLITALPFHIYAVTESALATSGWLMSYMLPSLLFGSLAGVFADRWDRRKLMIATNLLQMLTIPLLLLVQSADWIWIVYVVGFLEATLGTFFAPAESALLPTLVEEDQLVSANSLNALNDNLARIIGPVLGGAALGIWGLGSVVLLDALSFLFAALLLVAMRLKVSQPPKTDHALELPPSFWTQLRDGLRFVTQDRRLVNLFIVAGVALFGDAILSAIIVVFFQESAGLDATTFGWALTARGVGGFIGGLLIAQYGNRFSTRQLATVGLVLSGAVILVIVSRPTAAVVVIGMALVGMPVIAWIIALQTALQTATEDSYRGRVFGTYGTVVALLMIVGSGVGGFSADLVGSPALVISAALFYIFAGILAWFLLAPYKTACSTAATTG